MTPGVLLVLDGWGSALPGPANMIAAAATPHLDRLAASCPRTLAAASGEAVGLAAGVVGNSEIGHMVIGAGRPLPYDSVLVAQAINTGRLREYGLLRSACEALAVSGRSLHLIGLCSDGQIHADLHHNAELLHVAASAGVRQVHLHAITDGRDVANGSAAKYLDQLAGICGAAGIGRIATVVGRNLAMEKGGDIRRLQAVVGAMADGAATLANDWRPWVTAIERDGDVPPLVLTGADGRIQAGDTVLFTNFRSDRIQGLADLLVQHRTKAHFLSLAQYDTEATIPALVNRADAGGGLADQLERHGVRSTRIAEPVKFDHVTYYLNGRNDRVRGVEQYRRIEAGSGPAMNVRAVAEAVVSEMDDPDTALIVANLANIDVIGHTGDAEATLLATQEVDSAVGRICDSAWAAGRWVLLVGDHGNGERMFTEDGAPYGGHTTNPVPLILVPAPGMAAPPRLRDDVTLADVAPTVLTLLGLPLTAVMTGKALI
ncbi:phosphoglycerate mutase (2,3-diphosphoglycerate-independent) [Pseudonocardiaceae bacterium YIM PH 21723]|nr:phosphoglycerate mutase (2,3-diphosphoglycerate-independent) [Pseudonocardiaceae bacterium YIM PH 21723]